MCKGGIVFKVITPWFCTAWVINICSTPGHGLQFFSLILSCGNGQIHSALGNSQSSYPTYDSGLWQ
ncbi:hypothetical protein BHE74_00017165 [Ensete ventricosum]|uniref:Uncharacterized protein n=1 Tax=Ensete ventricosum TaxID=4639 RepID=A0A427AKS7_ENSVE|nr:hypothetical protein B296_00029600 [Ensete ventricosum]RWW74869.1 hypothetical protein BHE74_00017165 [Ensete ventricosum]RZR92838.1 hypothetical protein BHM03_00021202 [Ensete ventricosum]